MLRLATEISTPAEVLQDIIKSEPHWTVLEEAIDNPSLTQGALEELIYDYDDTYSPYFMAYANRTRSLSEEVQLRALAYLNRYKWLSDS